MRELIDAWRSLNLDVKRREDEFKASIEEDKLALTNLEGWIRDEMTHAGIRSVKITGKDVPDYLAGTAYLSTKVSSKVEDTQAFFDFVLKTGRTELLFARAADKAVQEYVEEEKVPPPGVTVHTADRLNFRKSS